MSEEPQLPAEIKNAAIDYVAAGAKSVLGTIPFAGSLLAEVAGSVIPEQRMDRIARFAAALQRRIAHLEEQAVRAEIKNEEFTELLEEALRQAARSTSEERREYLASALANSLTNDAIQHSETKHLLRIMGELNDIEIIWLRFYQDPVLGGDQEFRHKHAGVLERKNAYIGCSTDELDRYALQESYRKHLVDLGLVTPVISKGRDGHPEFDTFSGNFKISYHHTSPLGNLLLRTIGLSQSDDKQQESTLSGKDL